jgi:glutamine amidotransferase
MCRHVAYVGDPLRLQSALVEPPHGLVVQSWAPRRQRHGVVNADGFGLGWYADGDPVPARYRRSGPIWGDPCFADLARVITTRAFLAAVRSATTGTDAGVSAAAPYAHGRWLFSHNGVLHGWSSATGCPVASPAGGLAENRADGLAENRGEDRADGLAENRGEDRADGLAETARTGGDPYGQAGPCGTHRGAGAAERAVHLLAADLPAADLIGLAARCDSALIWAMVLGRLRAGAGLSDALTGTLGDLSAAGAAGRFNLLLTDGEEIAATTAGDSLCYRREPSGVTVASEPSDDDPRWREVADGSVLTATPRSVTIRSLTPAMTLAAR